ncbi:hypothetical protein HispidOSU_029572, partial [Sigmodon hispidus]
WKQISRLAGVQMGTPYPVTMTHAMKASLMVVLVLTFSAVSALHCPCITCPEYCGKRH